jgi:prepilin signal peptidase PulO-like enzyme (type II secretory pathway)
MPAMLPPPSMPGETVYALAALLGAGAGAAVNALADRVAGDEEPPWRGDACAACHKALPARRLLPLVGVMALGRRCPACGAALSWRRPTIDGALLLLFPLLLAHALGPGTRTGLAPWALWAVQALVAATLALIFVIDLEHRLVLDVVTYPAAAGLVGLALVLDRKALASMAIGLVIGGGLFLLCYGLGFVLYGEEALGFGDVKLAALLGLAVGWPGIVGALVLGALFGAAVSVALLGTGRATGRSFIPFGTFLCLGGALALLTAAPAW